MAVVLFVWYPMVALLLRPWIHLPLLPFGKRRKWLSTLHQLRPAAFVLVGGILFWGWPCFAGLALFDYVSGRYWRAQSVLKLPTHGLLWSFLICSVAGVGYGCIMRALTAPRNDDQMTMRPR